MSQRPVAIGLLLCEQVVIEEGTKNVTPVNCFIQRSAAALPWTSPPFVVAAWLTDGNGAVELEVLVEDVDTLEEVYKKAMPFRFAAPLQQLRMILRLNSLVFSAAGPYRVALLADGEIIAQRKFVVVLKESSHE